MEKKRKGNKLQEIFDRLVGFLRSDVKRYGLGWEERAARIKLDFHPEHLRHLSPEQIYSPNPSYQPNLGNILWHLLDNCGDHAGIEGKEMQISVRSKKEGGMTSIEVCDNGQGIPALGKRKRDARNVIGHSGSNLALAVQDAWRLRGDIVVENRINRKGEIEGAKFTILLPDIKKG